MIRFLPRGRYYDTDDGKRGPVRVQLTAQAYPNRVAPARKLRVSRVDQGLHGGKAGGVSGTLCAGARERRDEERYQAQRGTQLT